jgi:hypothetical protein
MSVPFGPHFLYWRNSTPKKRCSEIKNAQKQKDEVIFVILFNSQINAKENLRKVAIFLHIVQIGSQKYV